MSIQKKIRKTCLITLGCKAEPWDSVWEEIKELSEAFGERKVSEAFDEWAETRKGDILTKPVAEFLKIAPGLCTGVIELKPNGNLFDLLNQLAVISDNRVVFNRDQQSIVRRLLSTYSPADIKSAFQEFWGNIENDDFAVRNAAKTFVEAAEQLLFVRAKRAEKAREAQRLLHETLAREQNEHLQEMNLRAAEEEELAALVEDTLPEG